MSAGRTVFDPRGFTTTWESNDNGKSWHMTSQTYDALTERGSRYDLADTSGPTREPHVAMPPSASRSVSASGSPRPEGAN